MIRSVRPRLGEGSSDASTSAGASTPDVQRGPESAFEGVAFILTDKYLTGPELHTLLSISKSTAAAVLGHAPHPNLTLRSTGQPAADDSDSKQQAATAMRLVGDLLHNTHHPRLTLVIMDGCMITPTATLWPRVSELHLTNVDFPLDQLVALGGLTRGQPLHMLRLQNCNLLAAKPTGGAATTATAGAAVAAAAAGGSAAAAGGAAAAAGGSVAAAGGAAAAAAGGAAAATVWPAAAVSRVGSFVACVGSLVRKLVSVVSSRGAVVSSTTTTKPRGIPVRSLTSVDSTVLLSSSIKCIDHDCLEQLSWDTIKEVTGKGNLLEQLPNLKQLHWPNASVGDAGFQRILAHPNITLVTLWYLNLTQDRSSAAAAAPPSLQHITVMQPQGGGSSNPRPISFSTLGNLPLAHITDITIHGALSLGPVGSMSKVQDKVQPYMSKVVCLGIRSRTAPQAPTEFELHFPRRGNYDRFYIIIRDIIAMCAKHPQLVILSIHNFPPHPALIPLLALLAALPPTVTTLRFVSSSGLADWEGSGSFINHLPDHVTHVVLFDWRLTGKEVRRLVSKVRRDVKITFHDCEVTDEDEVKDADEEEEEDEEEDEDAYERKFVDKMRRWIRESNQGTSYRVEVQVVGGLFFL